MNDLVSIGEIKRLIDGCEKQKEDLRINYEKSVADVDKHINELKIRLADIILNRSGSDGEAVRQKTFVSVKFNDNGKTYDYLWDSQEDVKVGDSVQVENRWGGMQMVEVVRVFKEYAEYMDYDYKSAYPVSEVTSI